MTVVRVIAVAMACATVNGCAFHHSYIPYEVSVVRADGLTPIANASVHVRYGIGEIIGRAPKGIDTVTDANGRAVIKLAEWGNTFIQVSSTRYHIWSCGVSPRGWYHPDGFEYGDGHVTHGPGDEVRIAKSPPIPAADPRLPEAALYLEPLAAFPHGDDVHRSGQECARRELFPEPSR